MLVTGSADSKLMDEWDGKLRACQQARQRFERDWSYNMAFFFGRQWVRVVKTNGVFSLTEEKPKDSWRVRHTANRIIRIVRTELTKLTKEEPQFFCVPKSSEESDRLAAMAGETIAEFLLDTKYFNKKRSLATFWAILCGTGYLKTSYNSGAIERDGLPGRMDFSPITPFHLFVPNLLATEMEDQPYTIQSETMSPEVAQNMFGVELEPKTESNDAFNDTRFLTSLGVLGEARTNDATKLCYIKEVHVMPNKQFPNGAHFIYGDGQMLYVDEALPEQSPIEGAPGGIPPEIAEMLGMEPPVGDLGSEPETTPETGEGEEIVSKGVTGYDHEYPYKHRRFPYVKIDHIPTGMWYGDSIVKHLISSQKEYNRTRSIMLEHRNITSQPQYSYVAGAFDPRRFNGKPRLLLPINMGFEPPKPIEQPEISTSIGNELEVIIRDMDDISSQFEVSKGRTPPGVEAASAIAYLSEENDSILHYSITSIENAVQEIGVQALSNVHQFWEPERIVKMTSENQMLEIRAFTAEDLNPSTDFRVVAGSMAPRSEAAKQAFIVELMDRGLPLEKALKYLRMNETNKLYDDLMLDNNHAMRENVMMAQGQRLTKIDVNAPPPQMPSMGMPPGTPGGMPGIDPSMGAPNPMMDPMAMLQPQNKTDIRRDELGSPIIDEATGQPETYEVTINPFDNHQIHIEEHQNFQKTQEFEMLPPEIQQIIQDHVDEHKGELVKESNALRVNEIQQQGAEQEMAMPPPETEEAMV